MRPPAAGSPSAGSPKRKQSITNTSPSLIAVGPTAFFMASESMLDASQTPTASMNETTFGVRSLAEETHVTADPSEKEEGRRRSTIIAPRMLVRDVSKDSLSMGSFASSSSDQSSPSRLPQQPRVNSGAAERPRISSTFQSPIIGVSEPGSPNSPSLSSFRPSDDDMLDDRSSQAVMSDSEDEIMYGPVAGSNATAPQLIMPSIMMPSRRPFSSQGNSMGRLKILLAGASGTGKTSLIKSIVQTCSDIVHIDASTSTATRSKRAKSKVQGYNKTKQISETCASTKAYTPWWSDLEESKVLRRRKSGDGTVLERNICFVDTPGYDAGTSILEGMDNVMRYIERQAIAALDTTNLNESELLHLLGGGGSASQVDAILYLLAHPVKPADLEFMKQLSTMGNVIPLLAHVDVLPAEKVEQIQASISKELASADIKIFPLSTQNSPHHLYTVCSSPSKDLENMDASLLMQSDYIQPLYSSELSLLTEHLFRPETIKKLKYFAAKKVVRNRSTPQASTHAPVSGCSPTFVRSSTAPSPSNFFNPQSQALINRSPTTMTYSQAAVTDHTLREERLARVHLANWATNLQRSLANERARYQAIARAERAEWLKARLGECVFEQDLVPSNEDTKSELAVVRKNSPRLQQAPEKRGGYVGPRSALHDPADPLGLLRWRDELGTHGVVLLRVMGGAGLAGAVGTFLFFAVRNWSERGGFGAGTPSFWSDWWEIFD